MLILQHQKERAHPFNTARMVRRAFRNSQLIYGRNEVLGRTDLPLGSDAGLLYPGPDAHLLSELESHQRPKQLVILDGTWHQAKTLFRDVPAIQKLPRYRLAPPTPGQYRIRLEPTDTSLSTVEATVAALKILEPETSGLERVIASFNRMVETQLAHPQAQYDGVALQHRQQTKPNIPYALIHDWRNCVIAYGESIKLDGQPNRNIPLYWVAQRLGTGELFRCTIKHGKSCPASLSEDLACENRPEARQLLDNLKLTDSDFAASVSPEEFGNRWSAFLRRSDTLAVYNQSSLKLLENIGTSAGPHLVLKSVKLSPDQGNGSLEQMLGKFRLPAEPSCCPGRAGERLAGLLAYAKYLHKLGRDGFRQD